jgi:rhamnosyl/mannosyltransferase
MTSFGEAMRIIHLYSNYLPLVGGIEIYAKVLAEAQARAGHEVHVLCYADNRATSREIINGVNVTRVGNAIRVKRTPLGLRYIPALKKMEPDIVHLHIPFVIGEIGVRKIKAHVPVVTTYHCEPPYNDVFLPRVYELHNRRALERSSAIIVTSEPYAKNTPRLVPFSDKCRVIPIGTNTNIFKPDGPKATGPSAPLLFVGKPRKYKGLDYMMEALALIPDVTLDIVGNGPETPCVRAWADKNGVANRVNFLGELADDALAAQYRGAKILLLPSMNRIETFGIVLIEAMACGCPCLSTEVGTGTSWVVQDGVTGRVVPPCRPDLLAAAISEMLANPDLLKKMGQAGVERVQRLFTREQMINEVEKLYQELLGSAK